MRTASAIERLFAGQKVFGSDHALDGFEQLDHAEELIRSASCDVLFDDRCFVLHHNIEAHHGSHAAQLLIRIQVSRGLQAFARLIFWPAGGGCLPVHQCRRASVVFHLAG